MDTLIALTYLLTYLLTYSWRVSALLAATSASVPLAANCALVTADHQTSPFLVR